MPSPTDFTAVARAKLVAVLGAAGGERTLASVLRGLELERIETADDLYRFAEALSKERGFAGAVGGLLSVHAVMHGARAR